MACIRLAVATGPLLLLWLAGGCGRPWLARVSARVTGYEDCGWCLLTVMSVRQHLGGGVEGRLVLAGGIVVVLRVVSGFF